MERPFGRWKVIASQSIIRMESKHKSDSFGGIVVFTGRTITKIFFYKNQPLQNNVIVIVFTK